MKQTLGVLALAMTGVAPLPLAAYPDGAPWGSADPNGVQSCSSCHYDGESAYNSSAITLYGWPDNPTPGDVYELVLNVTKFDETVVGFLVEASAGVFEARVDANEVRGKEIRSTAPLGGEKSSEWILHWRAPDHAANAIAVDIAVDIAVNVANDDLSPFGDEIHFRTFDFKADKSAR